MRLFGVGLMREGKWEKKGDTRDVPTQRNKQVRICAYFSFFILVVCWFTDLVMLDNFLFSLVYLIF
jgi:hypothetical protein